MTDVKEFISTTGVKQLVEKKVKPRPSIEELTKIEVPGKPVSALSIEKNKKRKKKSTTKKSKKIILNTKIESPKGDSILIITEKPQAAQKIATALAEKTPKKYTESGASYFELTRNGEKIIVANAVGHLFNLTYAAGQKGYPIFKTEWIPSYTQKSAAFTKKYLTLLEKLRKKAKEFIIATDFDNEGEVIGWNVLRFICRQKTAKRMKYSTLTKPELEKSYENLLPELSWGQAYAGETRHIIDWLYGINLSRALMSAIKSTGNFRLLSIGRVQGPALKIIVDREKEIQNFKSQPYWNVHAEIKNKNENLILSHPKDIFDKKDLEKFKDIKEGIAETKDKEEIIPPPTPFDLTTLQREAYRYYKISPSQTLQIAQKLYLDGLISYPRTSSQKIPESIEPKKILKTLSKNFSEYVKQAKRSKPIEGKKSDPAHPSIYPTGEFKKLEEREKKLYELIVKRFISVFCEDALTENRKIILTAKENIDFTISGAKMKIPGWTNVYPYKINEISLPEINGKIKIDKIDFEEKETQPPKRYSPASLITILEKKNLGTKATRSSIVDTLFQRGYLDGQSIKATPLGLNLIESLEKNSPIIIDEKLTRMLEKKMDSILSSNNSPEILEKEEKEVILETEKNIAKISEEFKKKESEIGKTIMQGITQLRELQDKENIIMPCPVCNSGNLKISYSPKTRRQFVACSAYPKCTTTYPLPPNGYIKNTGNKNEEGLPLLISMRKGKKPWIFPFDPNWREKNPDYKSKSSNNVN